VPGARFEILSPSHLAALTVVAAIAAVLVWMVRRRPAAGRPVRIALAALLVAASGFFLAALLPPAWTLWDVLPLHLCDFLILLAVFALLTLHPLACELLYFCACSGTALAMVTPDLLQEWPAPEFAVYFALHGGVVVSALVVTALRPPRPGAALRAWGLLNLYALAVGAIDLAAGMNFLFLCAPPPTRTLLDWMGPWPIYLIVADAIALALFLALTLPFRRLSRQRDPDSPPGRGTPPP
jgi:hypothetical integral membrane protein (TIGR02206 family)